MRYKYMYAWKSQKDFDNRKDLPDSQKVMYLRVDTNTVEQVTCVTESRTPDLGFPDVESLGRVYDRCMNKRVWSQLTPLERDGWIESTVQNAL